ncbi:MAG: hypothetical protein EBQ96_01120 [Proteobacteria bacterium]|nr:hypothetical protein [Pseudomonadota bacterium]
MAQLSESKLTFIAIMMTMVALLVGYGVFYMRYAYAEDGHNLLAVGYLVACIFLFFAVRLSNIFLLILAVGLVGGIQVYATKKFDWRQNYIQLAEMGQPFFLEEFIERYPTFEEYTFKFLKAPDWVRFNDDCVQPALLNQVVPPRCSTFDLISRYYNIEIQPLMSAHYGKMRRTAKMIEEGKMKKRSEYAQCIANKSCATIPLLPKGVDAEKLDASSRDYIGVRQAFWSLINDKKMSQEVCALTPLCRALVNMKTVDPGKLPF